MNNETIIAAIVGGLLGYWLAAEHHRQQCARCNASAAQADPLAWLGSWQA